jgi:hypothetical protein
MSVTSPSVLVSALCDRLGEPRVLTAREDILPYGFDGTATLKQLPACVVFPRDAADVSFILKLAREHHAPVVTRGSGTGLSGGSVPLAGSIVLCLVKMDRILEVDTANLTLRAEAGAITQKIYETADAAGLFYPPDPGSMKISTIGGNVAENSGGLRGLKYGVTRDYVMGLEVVLADGSICWLGSKCVKDVAGYNLRDLFIGSEGTLGVVFLPTAFMGGIPGKSFKQFGWTAAIAVLFSLLVARLLTPMMAAYMMKPKPATEEKDGWIMSHYLRMVRACLAHPAKTLGRRRRLFRRLHFADQRALRHVPRGRRPGSNLHHGRGPARQHDPRHAPPGRAGARHRRRKRGSEECLHQHRHRQLGRHGRLRQRGRSAQSDAHRATAPRRGP